MLIEQVRLLCYMFFCELEDAQHSIAFLSFLSHGPTKTPH